MAELQPKIVHYNNFHNFVWVCNSVSIKLFSLKDGQMTNLHHNLFPEDHIILVREDIT